VANTLVNLADQATSTGSLPEALALVARLEDSHRRQENTRDLPFDLAQRAELLIRLGRMDDADAALAEIAEKDRAGVASFTARRRKVTQLRALMAAERGLFEAAEASGLDAVAASASLKKPDTTQYQAAVLLAYAGARLRRPERVMSKPDADTGSRSFQREFRYWRALELLARENFTAALRESDAALAGIERPPSAEYEWRMAAIASQAARKSGDVARADTMQARSRAALQRVRDAWKTDAVAYERRADLMDRKREIGID
jgi:hypothetical protein